MSAIWGCIDLSGKAIDSSLPEIMSRCSKKYKIDRISQFTEKNIYMCCGLQYITKESHRERIPFCEDGIYFVADCLLDDRERLIKELQSNGCSGVSLDTPDGDLLFCSYKVWGESFGEHVIGMFAFAVYDSNKNEFHLYTDHTSSRCIHYHIRDNKVYFGTLTDCIIDALPDINICDKFMVASQVLNLAFIFLFEGLTPFEDVFILPYGTGVRIKRDGDRLVKENIRYWNPVKKIKQQKVFDDEKYRKRFIETHFACVRDAIRTEGNIGVLLSSGLDSTSVASAAATVLKEQNKELNSYTSIPLKAFREANGNKRQYYIDDESKGVLRFCKEYPNIKPSFLACEGKSPWTYLEMWNEYMEMPGKSYVNHTWMQDAFATAGADGCRVVLNGAHGNFTVSHGSMGEAICESIKRFRFRTAINQFTKFVKKEKIGKRRYIKYLFKCLFPTNNYDEVFDNVALKKELINKYDSKHVWENMLRNIGSAAQTRRQREHTIVFSSYFQLTGVYDTKDGLYNGIIIRDPTQDKRMLELCLELPFECYAWDAIDRRLVREYLKDYIPDEIRLINRQRGRQSGDVVMRMDQFVFPDGRKPWEMINADINKYYDKDAVIAELKTPNTDETADWKLKVVSCNLFLSKYLKKSE